MVLRSCLCVTLLVGIFLMGCGGNPSEEAKNSTPTAPPEDVKVDLKQKEGGYTVHVKSGSEELSLQAEGSGDDSYNMVVQSKEGEVKMSAGSAAKLPDGFPQDIPTYPGMNLTFSQSMQENQTFNLQATSADPFEKVASHFKAQTASQGWTETTVLDQNEGGKPTRVYSGTKEGRVLTILLSGEEQGTSITITTAQQ